MLKVVAATTANAVNVRTITDAPILTRHPERKARDADTRENRCFLNAEDVLDRPTITGLLSGLQPARHDDFLNVITVTLSFGNT